MAPPAADGRLPVVKGLRSDASSGGQVGGSVGGRSGLRASDGGGGWVCLLLTSLIMTGCEAETVTPAPLLEVGGADVSGKKWLAWSSVDWRPDIVYGPQGGHHVWVGVRVQRLDPVDLQMSVEMWLADSGVRVKPGRTVRMATLRQEGHWLVFSKLFGYLACPCQVRDRELRVRVEVVDRQGQRVVAESRITPRWTNACNMMQRSDCVDICHKAPTTLCQEQ